MVFFTCNACGQAVKKNQVEKHYKFQCRNCEVLSCMDCGKDFHGDEYMGHVKCVSENEKYGGKDYKPKPNSNKGEAKQEEWVQLIQNAINTARVRPALSQLLKQLMTFSNIPRSEVKFQKFLQNSVKVHDIALIKEAWEILNKAREKNSKPSSNENGLEKPEGMNENNINNKRLNADQCPKLENEERANKKHKSSKYTNVDNIHQVNHNKTKEHYTTSTDPSSETGTECRETKKSKKRKKKKEKDNESVQEDGPDVNNSMESEIENSSIANSNDDNKEKKKFNWRKVIKAVLKNSPDNELSLKKLQKKVLAEYYARGGEQRPMDENELRAMFRQKVTSNPKFRVHKEKVKLVR